MKPFSNNGVFLFVAAGHGDRLGQHFAANNQFVAMGQSNGIDGVSPWAIHILRDGPDNAQYWSVWDDVLESAYVIDDELNEWTLMLDRELFLICPALMDDETRTQWGVELDESAA